MGDFDGSDSCEGGPLATPADACRQYARAVGATCPERAWILTDYDTWEPNPFYQGPPVRHPEDDDDESAVDGNKAP
jgi:hypothetical protein